MSCAWPSVLRLFRSKENQDIDNRTDIIIIVVITTRHASWRIGQHRSSSTHVCHWPASVWWPSCGSCSSILRQVVFGLRTY